MFIPKSARRNIPNINSWGGNDTHFDGLNPEQITSELDRLEAGAGTGTGYSVEDVNIKRGHFQRMWGASGGTDKPNPPPIPAILKRNGPNNPVNGIKPFVLNESHNLNSTISSIGDVFKGAKWGTGARAGLIGAAGGALAFGALKAINPSEGSVDNVGVHALKGAALGAGVFAGGQALHNLATKDVSKEAKMLSSLGDMVKKSGVKTGSPKVMAATLTAIAVASTAGSFSMTRPVNSP